MTIEGQRVEAGRRAASRAGVFTSRAAVRACSGVLLLVASVLVTVSALAAVLPLLGMDSSVIAGGSMRPALPAGALVVSQPVDPASVQAGEVITFRRASAPTVPVTHRVVRVLREGDGSARLLTRGDADPAAEPELAAADLPVSKMAFSLPVAGAVLEFSRTTPGRLLLIVAPGFVLLLGLGRRSGREEDEAVAEGPAPKKDSVSMVTATPATHPAAPALARIAQRTAPAPARPGLLRRLAAAIAPPPEAELSAVTIEEVASPALAQAVASAGTPIAATAVNARIPLAAAAPIEQTDEQTVAPLLHLARMRLRSVARLTDITRSFDRVEEEAAPLLDLVGDLEQVRRRFAANLDEAMRPITEFADRWDENLVTLAQQMDGDLPLPNIDIDSERRRIAEIRAQVPHRHSLLLQQFETEREAIDAALTVFDDQVARLEAQLTAARRTAEAIGDSMRTADFGRTVVFLRRRMEQLSVLAERGAATPDDIAASLPAAATLAADDEEMLLNSPYLASVIAVLDARGDETERAKGWGAA